MRLGSTEVFRVYDRAQLTEEEEESTFFRKQRERRVLSVSQEWREEKAGVFLIYNGDWEKVP